MKFSRRTFLAALFATAAQLPSWAKLRVSKLVVFGAGQTGNVLVTTGWAKGKVLQVGDCFTIEGLRRFEVRGVVSGFDVPIIHAVTQTTVTEHGHTAIMFWPPIIPTGCYQNVADSPAQGALIHYPYIPSLSRSC